MTRMRLRDGAARFSAAAGWIGLLAGGATLAIAAAPVLAPAYLAGRLLAAAEDPGALAEIRLERAATPERLEAGLDAAVAAEDEDLALSFLALAETRGLPVDPTRRARVEALAQGRMGRAARDFAAGAVSGNAEGTAGLAGSLALADIEPLGSLGAHYLGFRGGLCHDSDRRQGLDPARVAEAVRALRAHARRNAA